MEIALIITGGLILITLISVVGSIFLEKKKKENPELESLVKALEKRVFQLETNMEEKETRIEHLESDLKFINKLIEDKTK